MTSSKIDLSKEEVSFFDMSIFHLELTLSRTDIADGRLYEFISITVAVTVFLILGQTQR